MAVINQVITDSTNLLTHPQSPGQVSGQKDLTIQKRIEVLSTDNNGSKYLICLLKDTALVDDINVEVAASLASANDNDIGLYDMHGNAKVTATTFADYYLDGGDWTAAGVSGVGAYGGKLFKGATNRGTLGQAAAGQEVYLDAGDVVGPFPAVGSTLKSPMYQLIWTMNTAEAAHKFVLFTVKIRYAF